MHKASLTCNLIYIISLIFFGGTEVTQNHLQVHGAGISVGISVGCSWKLLPSHG